MRDFPSFTETNGRLVYVNPMQVRYVLQRMDELTDIRFTPDDMVTVKETPAYVAQALGAALRG